MTPEKADRAGTTGVPPQAEVEIELLRLLAMQKRFVLITVFFSDALLALVVANRIDQPWRVWVWLAIVALVLIGRWRAFEWLLSTDRLDPARKLKFAAAAIAVNGVAHAAVTLSMPELPATEGAFLSLLLLGFCAGAVGNSAGYRPMFLAFVVPIIVALCSAWALGTGTPSTRFTEWLTALLVLVFGTTLFQQARDFFRMFKESFDIRQQHSELNHQLRAALDEADSANRAKTRFLASASHDLRQPMHTLTLFGAALALRPLDEGSRRIAKDMSSALESLSAQLDALLDISKLDAGVVPVRASVFFLADFLQKIAAGCRPLASRKGLQLRVDCPPNAVCEADEALLARVLRNLVDNAIKYTQTGSVAIVVKPVAANWSVTVTDTGIGIDAEQQHKVFEEFYQVDNPERDRSRGLGLGLSIVRRLSKLLGLELRMQSTVGKGTEFVLSVPRSEQASIVVRELNDLSPQSLQGLCVLVLDDEESVRRGMRSLLEGLGAQVLLAGCIAEAVDHASNGPRPDIVLADLRLRGHESGIDAVARLHSLHPDLPALFISGDIASDRLQDVESAGIALLHKPVAVETLCAAIQQAIRNRENNESTRPASGDSSTNPGG